MRSKPPQRVRKPMGALTDKYCIVGVGETPHMRPSNRTRLSMACEAIKNAMADAGLQPRDIDGLPNYQAMDWTSSNHIAPALGIRLNYSLDIMGGGSSTEALVMKSIGLLEAGCCDTIVVFRSMNGRSNRRMGGQSPGGPVRQVHARGDGQYSMPWGSTTPAQPFAMSPLRSLHDPAHPTRPLSHIPAPPPSPPPL